MLAYKDKIIENLTLQETYEFEKEMNKLTVGTRDNVQPDWQINTYIALIRDSKVEILERERLGIDNPHYAEKQKALDIGDEQKTTLMIPNEQDIVTAWLSDIDVDSWLPRRRAHK